LPARVVSAGPAAHVAPYRPAAETHDVAIPTLAQVAPYRPAREAPRIVALGAPLSLLAVQAPMRSARGAASMPAMPEPPIGFSVHPSLAVVPEAQDPGPAPPVASTVTLRIGKRRR